MKKLRVERARTDHGYGPGWVVLDKEGFVITPPLSWERALAFAWYLVKRGRLAL